jgi:predicted house-cleaning noncanonical NTP pyrophosphatase (MazG superfamily)
MKKLIRDKYKDIIEPESLSNIDPKSEEYKAMLLEKLEEELTELREADFGDIEEYADVIEVLLSLGKYHNLSFPKILEKTLSKRQKNGSFNDGLILETVEG